MKLVVGGCSVSDYTHVDKVWGSYLADTMGATYIHEGAGCGSNYRIWRRIGKQILQNDLGPQDYILIQYTTRERTEFFSHVLQSSDPYLRDEYVDGSIVRYKLHAQEWSKGLEKKLFETYENFISEEFETEKFELYNLMFQSLCKQYGLQNVFFVNVGSYGTEDLSVIHPYKELKFPEIFKDAENCLPNDNFHLSKKGHKLLADLVYRGIQ